MVRKLILCAAGLAVCIAHVQAKEPAEHRAMDVEIDGPIIKGMCVLSRENVLRSAKVAKSVDAQYRQRVQSAQLEIDREREQLQADAKLIQEKKPKRSTAESTQDEKEVAARLASLQEKAGRRAKDLEEVRRTVLENISREAQPLISEIYQSRKCGLLIAREAVLAGNSQMDITAAVVDALDRKIVDMPLPESASSGRAAN